MANLICWWEQKTGAFTISLMTTALPILPKLSNLGATGHAGAPLSGLGGILFRLSGGTLSAVSCFHPCGKLLVALWLHGLAVGEAS